MDDFDKKTMEEIQQEQEFEADMLAEIQSQQAFDNLDDMFYWDADKGCTSSPAGKHVNQKIISKFPVKKTFFILRFHTEIRFHIRTRPETAELASKI